MKKFRFLYIAAAALLFAACANEEDGIGNNGPVAATVKADISNNIKTRGTADYNAPPKTDRFGAQDSNQKTLCRHGQQLKKTTWSGVQGQGGS